MKIPLWGLISLAAVVLVQSASLLIWGARIDERTSQNSASIAELTTKSETASKLAETVARVDERTQALVITVNRIDNRFDKRADH